MPRVRELTLSYVFFDKPAPLNHNSQTNLFLEVKNLHHYKISRNSIKNWFSIYYSYRDESSLKFSYLLIVQITHNRQFILKSKHPDQGKKCLKSDLHKSLQTKQVRKIYCVINIHSTICTSLVLQNKSFLVHKNTNSTTKFFSVFSQAVSSSHHSKFLKYWFVP